ELRPPGGGQGGESCFPVLAPGGALPADGTPGLQDLGGNLEGGVRPAVDVLRRPDLVGAEGRAMGAGGVLLLRAAEADMGLAVDEYRAVGGLRRGQRAVDVVGVVAVAGQHRPARG